MAVPNELDTALKEAYNYEARPGHEAEERETWYIGSMEKEYGKIYDLYKDSAGAYWYKIRRRMQDGRIVSEEEYVFGHRLEEKNRQRKIAANSRRFADYVKE